MGVQYIRGQLDFDTSLFDADLNKEGLITQCQKSTVSPPLATPDKFIPGAIIQSVSGNIYQNTGSTAIPVWAVIGGGGGNVITDKVSISSAEILALSTTPKELVAAPGPGLFVQLLGVNVQYNFVGQPYGTNTVLAVWYPGVAVDYFVDGNPFTGGAILTAFSSGLFKMPETGSGNASLLLENVGPVMYVQGGDPVLGGGDMDVYVTYQIITL